MCKHSSVMTEETCSVCIEAKVLDPGPVHDSPIYEGMTNLDNQAVRLGKRMRGFKFCDSSRQGARGRRRGKCGAE